LNRKKRFIYVGAKPDLEKNHPGGQSTASLGLIDYAKENGIELKIIDSAQESFPPPKALQRIKKALKRVVEITICLSVKRYSGAIIFSSAGPSFYEKILLALICRLYFVPCVLFVRSGHFMTEYNSSRFRKLILKKCLLIPNMLGAQGQNWKYFYEQIGLRSQRIKVVHNWITPGRSIAKHEKKIVGTPIFIFVGWLVKEKGVEELIGAIEGSEKLRDSVVMLAGGGTLKSSIEEKVRQKDLQNVRLLGWMSPSELDELYRQCHVFVLPSYAEGFPNSLLEAISQGLAVIATPVGGIPDSAQQSVNAELVERKNVSSLRKAMEKFVDNPELVSTYSRQSLEIARKNHDRDKNCSKLFGIFG